MSAVISAVALRLIDIHSPRKEMDGFVPAGDTASVGKEGSVDREESRLNVQKSRMIVGDRFAGFGDDLPRYSSITISKEVIDASIQPVIHDATRGLGYYVELAHRYPHLDLPTFSDTSIKFIRPFANRPSSPIIFTPLWSPSAHVPVIDNVQMQSLSMEGSAHARPHPPLQSFRFLGFTSDQRFTFLERPTPLQYIKAVNIEESARVFINIGLWQHIPAVGLVYPVSITKAVSSTTVKVQAWAITAYCLTTYCSPTPVTRLDFICDVDLLMTSDLFTRYYRLHAPNWLKEFKNAIA